MRASELEVWTLDVIDRIAGGQPVEDGRVELKAEWPEPVRAARRVAGHANASGGEQVLWIIGVDEGAGVVGARHRDLSTWYAQVKAQFEGLAPGLVMDLAVPSGDASVVALLFDTGRAPYVVKNPRYGQSSGGSVSLEVPWREGTSVRSATRSDLIRMLAPLPHLPDIELMQGELTAQHMETQTSAGPEKWLQWTLRLRLYVVPSSTESVVVPFHRCRAAFNVPAFLPERSVSITLNPDFTYTFGTELVPGGRIVRSLTIASTETEAIIDGPGVVNLTASDRTGLIEKTPSAEAFATATIRPTKSRVPLVIDAIMRLGEDSKKDLLQWVC